MSSHHPTPTATRIASKTPANAPAGDVDAEVAGLIAAGKCKQAVERAKEHHKRADTPESQKLLVEAYVSRIGQFREKGQIEDARTLITLVKERFPAHIDRLGMLETRTAATGGLVDELVAPLARIDLPDARREAIEAAIRQQLLDLHGLAESKMLPASHPLKIAAAAVWRAFEAATAGPVTDEQIALPEVSRRSPLVGWRMLIRAIAAFHRGDDEGCRRALEAIPPDAAVGRLTPVLLDIVQAKPAGRGAAGALQARIATADEPLRNAIASLERAFNSKYLEDLIQAVIHALRTCDAARPELTDTLRKRLMVRCIMADVPMSEVHKILGAAIRDASFWRLLARGYEQTGAEILASLAWERFIRHAIGEKWFADNSMEAAIVYGQMAGVVSETSPQRLDQFKRSNARPDFYAGFYRNQPPHVGALAPKNPQQVMDLALSPDALFRRAVAILPDVDTFGAWAAWAQRVDLPVKHQEDICLAWQRALPRDPEPPLRLSKMAEERNALSMALRRLAEAEAIDPFNPAVRKARSRLVIATFWRHMKDRKAHLAEKDLVELEALDSFKEGDRSAFLWAARAACHTLANDPDAAAQATEKVYEKMGSLAGGALLASVAMESKLESLLGTCIPDPEPLAAAQADARLARLLREVAIPMFRPSAWIPLVREVLKREPCPLGIDEILLIGQTEIILDDPTAAYLASSAGLARANGAEAARLLLLRARSLVGAFDQRAAQCLHAARELARQVHDPDLLNEISDEIADLSYFSGSVSEGKPLDPSVLAQILAAERSAKRFPGDHGADKHLVYVEPKRGFRGGGFPSFNDFFDPRKSGDDDREDREFDEDDDDEALAGLDLPVPGVPPQFVPALAKILKKYGTLPTPQQLMRDDPKLAAELEKLMGQLF